MKRLIQIDEVTLKRLKELKVKTDAKSYDMIITNLISKMEETKNDTTPNEQ